MSKLYFTIATLVVLATLPMQVKAQYLRPF